MSAATSKCYVNPNGFQDNTRYVEVFSDGTATIHLTCGGRSHWTASALQGPINRGEWVEIENPSLSGSDAGGAA